MEQNTRRVGTVSRGIRCPIIREGDDLAAIVTESVLEAAESEGFSLHNRDVISITESIAARAQGNYASVDAIAKDVKESSAAAPSALFSPFFPVTASPFACAELPPAQRKSCLCSAIPPTRWATAS